MVENNFPLFPVLIRHYAEPQSVEHAIYIYTRYIEDINIKKYNEKQIIAVCKTAVSIMKKWYTPNNINIWNENINSWLYNNQTNNMYHQLILRIIKKI